MTREKRQGEMGDLEGSSEGIDGGCIQMVAGLIQEQQVAGHQGKGG